MAHLEKGTKLWKLEGYRQNGPQSVVLTGLVYYGRVEIADCDAFAIAPDGAFTRRHGPTQYRAYLQMTAVAAPLGMHLAGDGCGSPFWAGLQELTAHAPKRRRCYGSVGAHIDLADWRLSETLNGR